MIDFLGRDPSVFIRIIIVTSLCHLENCDIHIP